MNHNIVASIDATFENITNFDADLSVSENIEADFGEEYIVEKNKILCDTTANWNSKPTLVAKDGFLYVYTDHRQNEQEQDIAGFKIGDGVSYLIDLPFTDDILYEDIEKLRQDIQDTSIDGAMYHLGFYLDEHGGLCQVNSI